MLTRRSAWVGCSRPSVWLFVRSITRKRMIKVFRLGTSNDLWMFLGLKGQRSRLGLGYSTTAWPVRTRLSQIECLLVIFVCVLGLFVKNAPGNMTCITEYLDRYGDVMLLLLLLDCGFSKRYVT